jgi:hypothetical protein
MVEHSAVNRRVVGSSPTRGAKLFPLTVSAGWLTAGTTLARCEFIERKENVLALGNSSTGKTHIALALGLAACQKGFRVRFTTAASLAHELIEAKDERRLMRFQKMLSSFELLIIDELGFVPLSKTGAELLSRSSAGAMNAVPRSSPATCRSTNGRKRSDPSG